MMNTAADACVSLAPGQPSKMTESLSSGRAPPKSEFLKKPVVIIVIGMAGSGKTTLLQRLVAHLQATSKRVYVLNLDPAVQSLPFSVNIDIRDTVKYKNVMKEYQLGPNGGILTSLNMFVTKFDEVIALVEKRAHELDYVLVDTPGQIEIFTWSASGSIVSESFASTFPTVITYVVDTPRSTNPVTFMSNMVYACSILYKNRLPLLLTFNKTDVAQHSFAVQWMEDFESFQSSLDEDNSYTSGLSRSLCLALDEFYQNLHNVGVSAVTGEGMNDFFGAIEDCATEYMENYRMDLEARREQIRQEEEQRMTENMARLGRDIAESNGQALVLGPAQPQNLPREEEEEEEYEDDEDDDDDDDDD